MCPDDHYNIPSSDIASLALTNSYAYCMELKLRKYDSWHTDFSWFNC